MSVFNRPKCKGGTDMGAFCNMSGTMKKRIMLPRM